MTTSTTHHTDNSLAGKVAIVTGGGSGIGEAAALAYADKGAAVVVAGRRQAELNATVGKIVAAGGSALAVVTDITDEGSAASLIETTVHQFGRLDIAFNNAAINSYNLIENLPIEEFDAVFATNVRGAWLLMKYEIAAMRAAGHGGAIINTSSIAATGASAGLSAYAATKAALDAMTRVLALEIGGDGIRINNVSPGLTLTAMNSFMSAEALGAIAAHTALKRNAQPSDIGDVAVWLSTNEARHVTGQSILADGGYNLAGMR